MNATWFAGRSHGSSAQPSRGYGAPDTAYMCKLAVFDLSGHMFRETGSFADLEARFLKERV